MTTASISSGEGDAIRFIANFGGKRNEDAYLEVFFYPAGTSEAQARALAKEAATSRGLTERRADVPNYYKWSLAEYGFSSKLKGRGSIIGTGALGRHGDRFFRVTLQYPQDYAEGFVPRAHRILDEWRWEDTGQGF
ncbi:MAG: hypothetical protein HY314_16375 [Acidobacteria bacterium]|nr:hypothetical protein [Acidobacteriota bacterium]